MAEELNITQVPWKLILWGNEQYPYSLSIHTEDGTSWVARDGHVSSLEAAYLLGAAQDLLAAAQEALKYGLLWKHDEHCARKGKEPFSEPEDCTCWVQPMVTAVEKATGGLVNAKATSTPDTTEGD